LYLFLSSFSFTSEDFWFYDTNGQMLRTAYASSGIAMAAAAAAILLSSRSIVLTLYSTLTVGYVLTSVTATLVAMGWTLGFLEAILFAILIGISCDFVIHFSHAYARAAGNVDRSERTLHALLSMGPSILAAAVTTFLAATLMLFTVIIFFQKFAVVLFLTVLQATIGSFVVFLTITDTVGPSHPTLLFDKITDKFKAWRESRSGDES
jgi:predicted RND superfamily exporter protein